MASAHSKRNNNNFDINSCWSLLNHGVAEIKRLNLGNLNPIYEMELNKLDVRQVKGRRNVSRDGEGCKGCRHKYLLPGEGRDACAY